MNSEMNCWEGDGRNASKCCRHTVSRALIRTLPRPISVLLDFVLILHLMVDIIY